MALNPRFRKLKFVSPNEFHLFILTRKQWHLERWICIMRVAVSLVQILQLLNQDLLPLYLINFSPILKVKRRTEQAVLGIFTAKWEMKSPHTLEKRTQE